VNALGEIRGGRASAEAFRFGVQLFCQRVLE
jgi:hypothetical protein